MKFFKKIHGFPWFFYSDFHIFANAYDNIFLNYWHNFRENFDKIILKIWKKGKNSIRTIQKSPVSISFSIPISKTSLLLHETPYKSIFLNFLTFFSEYSQKIHKLTKNLEKISTFCLKFWNNCKFFIDFLEIFWKLLRCTVAPPSEPHRRRPTLQDLPWWTSLPPP